MLEVKNISFRYNQNQSFKGLKNVSMHVSSGELVTIIGESGEGKTTLLKCIYGLFDLNKGEIFFEGKKVLGPSFNLIPGHKEMKLVSQDYAVLDNHTVAENLADALPFYEDSYKTKRIRKLLHLCELTKEKDKKAKELSNGQKQRLSIARALAEFPKLLLLDEPFSNLDFGKRDELFTFIRENMAEHNAACIMVTHHPQEALRYADKVCIINDGKIIKEVSPEQAYYKPDTLHQAKLFGKCFELSKTDFIKNSPVKANKTILLRPEQLQLVSKSSANALLHGKVIAILFALSFYEYIIELDSGKQVSCFYSKKNVTIGDRIGLSFLG